MVFKEIAKAVILAIILIYMVLGAEFESFRQPFVIMMSLPFAVIGAVLALLLANQTANMMSLIGFTMLLGLVTKNAILLVDVLRVVLGHDEVLADEFLGQRLRICENYIHFHVNIACNYTVI